jgi:hypothetical protein
MWPSGYGIRLLSGRAKVRLLPCAYHLFTSASVAQWTEQLASIQLAVGSNPTRGMGAMLIKEATEWLLSDFFNESWFTRYDYQKIKHNNICGLLAQLAEQETLSNGALVGKPLVSRRLYAGTP